MEDHDVMVRRQVRAALGGRRARRIDRLQVRILEASLSDDPDDELRAATLIQMHRHIEI